MVGYIWQQYMETTRNINLITHPGLHVFAWVSWGMITREQGINMLYQKYNPIWTNAKLHLDVPLSFLEDFTSLENYNLSSSSPENCAVPLLLQAIYSGFKHDWIGQFHGGESLD